MIMRGIVMDIYEGSYGGILKYGINTQTLNDGFFQPSIIVYYFLMVVYPYYVNNLSMCPYLTMSNFNS